MAEMEGEKEREDEERGGGGGCWFMRFGWGDERKELATSWATFHQCINSVQPHPSHSKDINICGRERLTAVFTAIRDAHINVLYVFHVTSTTLGLGSITVTKVIINPDGIKVNTVNYTDTNRAQDCDKNGHT